MGQKLPTEPADVLSMETNKNEVENLGTMNSAEAPKSSGDNPGPQKTSEIQPPNAASGDVKDIKRASRSQKVSESSDKSVPTPSVASSERLTRPSTPQRVVTSRPPTPTRKFDEKYALIRERRKANEVKMEQGAMEKIRRNEEIFMNYERKIQEKRDKLKNEGKKLEDKRKMVEERKEQIIKENKRKTELILQKTRWSWSTNASSGGGGGAVLSTSNLRASPSTV